MSLLDRMMKYQTAVVWPTNGFDGNGQPTYNDPIEVNCRWEDKQEEFISKDLVRQLSVAIVYVDRDILVGSMIRLGQLTDLTDQSIPKNNTRTFEVRSFDSSPNFRHNQNLRKAYL